MAAALAGLRKSVWFPVAARAMAISLGMLALAGIGAASTLAGAGVPVAIAAPGSSGAEVRAPASHADGKDRTGPGAPASPQTSGVVGSGAVTGAPSPGVTPDGKVILNTATAEDLQKLPRIGAKRAAAILELRTRLGHFRNPTDLLRVRGIGRKTLRTLTPLFVVDAPRGADGVAAPPGRPIVPAR